MKGGRGAYGSLPPMAKLMRKRFYLGFQFSLFQDRQGLKFAFKIKVFKFYLERIWLLRGKRNFGIGNPDLTPKMESVEMLTEMPVVKQVEPEDMLGEIPAGKLIEPEDM